MANIQKAIESGKTALGIEFGSTRIKAVLIGEDHMPIASGSHEWENQYENGIWTYSLDAVWAGLQDSMPRAALLSIHARMAGTEPESWEDPSLVQVWGPRIRMENCSSRFVHGGIPSLGRHQNNSLNCSNSTFHSVGASPIFIKQS